MKRIVKLSIWCIMSSLVLAFVCILFLRRIPMTMCLTFDDACKAQATVAAPCLERHGWRGVFNVVTGRIESDKSLCPQMSWADIEMLHKAGHEIYPHSYMPDPESKTFSHYNLKALSDLGLTNEIERQVVEAKKQILQKIGVDCKFFCLPFNACDARVSGIIRANGMEPMNCSRRNFPTHPNREPISISRYVKNEFRKGTCHIDIMMHGIVRQDGGWEPFDDAEHFERFCDELKCVEDEGLVRIVSYSSSHPQCSLLSRVLKKVRRVAFSCWPMSL